MFKQLFCLFLDISPKPVRNVDLFSPFQKRKSLAEEVLAPDVSTVTSPKKKVTFVINYRFNYCKH